MPDTSRPPSGSVEAILARLQALPAEGEPARLELWVPNALSFRGQPVSSDVGMAVVLDALLARGFFPSGVQVESGGRLCRYVRE